MWFRRLNLPERGLLICSGILLGLAVTYGVWNYWANLSPDIVIPPQKLPTPNGFDYYMQASKAIVDGDKLTWALAPPRTAASTLHVTLPAPPKSSGVSPASPAHMLPATAADRTRLLRMNAEVLAKARAGMKHECVVPRSFDHTWLLGNLTRLFQLAAIVKAERGDWGGSMATCIDRIQLGNELSRGGYPRQIAADNCAWRTITHVDLENSRTLAHRMENILSTETKFAECQRYHNLKSQAALLDDFELPNWRQKLLRLQNLLDRQDRDKERMHILISSKRRLMTDFIEAQDEVIRISSLPYPAMPKRVAYLYSKCCFSDYGGLVDARCDWELAHAQNRLLTIALALRAYCLEHGTYPKSLSSLVSKYLSKLPNDPFSLKRAFRYRSSGTSYILYSLGPNCKDDGGKPSWVKSSSDDIVAGAIKP